MLLFSKYQMVVSQAGFQRFPLHLRPKTQEQRKIMKKKFQACDGYS